MRIGRNGGWFPWLLSVAIAVAPAKAATETVIHTFGSFPIGANPYGNLAQRSCCRSPRYCPSEGRLPDTSTAGTGREERGGTGLPEWRRPPSTGAWAGVSRVLRWQPYLHKRACLSE